MPASPASEEVYLSAHITPNSLLAPTIKAWRYYLDDQAMSPHTVKAFSGDLQLLAGYLPPDRVLGDITTSELANFLEWLRKRARSSLQPQDPGPAHHLHQGLLPLAAPERRPADRPGRENPAALGAQPAAGSAV